MERRTFTPEQIINKLREAEVLLSQGDSVGETQQYTAEGTYDDGSVVDITDQVSWASDESVATIDAGLATGVAEGSSGIIATLDGITSGTATLTVTAPAALAWWIVGVIIAAALAGGTVLFALLRRRRGE